MLKFNWLNNLITIARLIVLTKWRRERLSPAPKSTNAYILANGPSLTSEIEQLGAEFFIGKETVVVNYFVFSELFEKIKPLHYVVSAVELFQDVPPNTLKENNDRLYKELLEKTDWDLLLYVPIQAKKFHHWKKILDNPNIKVHYYNTTVAEGGAALVNWVLKKELGMPRLQNVLVAALTLMVNKKFAEIYLFGVDHSWLQEIHVTEDNEVLINQPHFYDKNSKAAKMIKNHEETRKLHEVLYKFYYSFKSYFDIKKFAATKNVQIYNMTKGSYIDAFERISIENLKSGRKES